LPSVFFVASFVDRRPEDANAGAFVVVSMKFATKLTTRLGSGPDRTLRLRNHVGTAKVDEKSNVKTDGRDMAVELKAGQTFAGEVK
jgi:hypothetical protein